MRRTVQIAGQVENLFGTLDENLKLLESSLQVTTFFHNDRLTVEGEPAHVERAVHILDQYNDLVREGRRMDNGAVKALFRVAAEDPNTSLRHILEPDCQRFRRAWRDGFPKRGELRCPIQR